MKCSKQKRLEIYLIMSRSRNQAERSAFVTTDCAAPRHTVPVTILQNCLHSVHLMDSTQRKGLIISRFVVSLGVRRSRNPAVEQAPESPIPTLPSSLYLAISRRHTYSQRFFYTVRISTTLHHQTNGLILQDCQRQELDWSGPSYPFLSFHVITTTQARPTIRQCQYLRVACC